MVLLAIAFFHRLICYLVSRIALDIICATAFDYHPDSVQQPDNGLATAYRRLLSLHSGISWVSTICVFSNWHGLFCLERGNLLRLICFLWVPGVPALLRTKFAVKFRKYLFFGPLSESPTGTTICFFNWNKRIEPIQTLVSALDDINTVCRPMMQAKLSEAAVKGSDNEKDSLSLLSRYRYSLCFQTYRIYDLYYRARLNDESDDYKMSDQDLIEQAVGGVS